MDDWRLTRQEDYLIGVTIKKVNFPAFWRKSYAEKNDFYRYVVNGAEKYVEEVHKGQEYLDGNKVRLLWHEHCEFCWHKIMADNVEECFCTPDYCHWICKECYDDFKDKFDWKVI